MLGLLIWMLAGGSTVLLVDDTYRIPAGDWRYVDVQLKQKVATIDCEFQMAKGASGVRLAIVTVDDMRRFRKGDNHSTIAGTSYATTGRLRARLPMPGRYAVVIDNRMEGRGPATVRLRVALDFSEAAAQARELTPERRWTVIAISLLVFFAIAVYSARKLRRAMASRPGAG